MKAFSNVILVLELLIRDWLLLAQAKAGSAAELIDIIATLPVANCRTIGLLSACIDGNGLSGENYGRDNCCRIHVEDFTLLELCSSQNIDKIDVRQGNSIAYFNLQTFHFKSKWPKILYY